MEIVDEEFRPVANSSLPAIDAPSEPRLHHHAHVRKEIDIRPQVVQPLIQIQRAVYGHPRDFFKVILVHSDNKHLCSHIFPSVDF